MRFFFSLLVLASLTMLAQQNCNQTTTNQTASNQTASSKTAANTSQPKQSTEDNVPRVSIDEAKAAVDAGKAIIVDVRDAMAYKTERIAGSIHIPVSELDKRLNELPKDKQIILYCS